MSTYRIKSGDTLSAIASRFNTSVSALAKANKIANPNMIYAGKSLQIPGHSGKSTFEPAKGGGKSGTGGKSGSGGTGGTQSTGSSGGAQTVNGIKVTPAMRKLANAG